MCTQQKIIDAIKACRDRDASNLALFNRLLPILEKFDGQKITKRLASAVEKACPDLHVFYRPEHGMFHLAIRRQDERWDDRKEFLLGHDTNPVFRIGEFHDDGRGSFCGFNRWAGSAASARIAKCEEQLADPYLTANLAKAFDQLRDATETLKGLMSYPFEGQYEIERALEIKLT
jgi:hypothetical protein